MKNKKYLLVLCIALLAILVSACTGTASASPAQAVDSQTASTVNTAPDVINTGTLPTLGNPVKGGPDLTAAAKTLGITVDELQQALKNAIPANCSASNGTTGQDPNCRPDLNAVATALGITVDKLQTALGGPNKVGPDLTTAASTLGVTVDELQQALKNAVPANCSASNGTTGQYCRPDLTAAATALGITTEQLHSALGNPPQGGRPSRGGSGNGQPPQDRLDNGQPPQGGSGSGQPPQGEPGNEQSPTHP